MTRYTTMGKKKQHVKADESFKVTPLKPGKPEEEKTDNNKKNGDYKRKRPASNYLCNPLPIIPLWDIKKNT